MLAKYVLVALTAMSPIGEELVSIPLGIGLGLDALTVALVSAGFNMLPALVISGLFWRAGKGTRIVRVLLKLRSGRLRAAAVWMLRRRSRRLVGAIDRWGIWGVLLVTPWAGVYATTLTLEAIGMRRTRLLASIAASLSIHAAVCALIAAGIFRLF